MAKQRDLEKYPTDASLWEPSPEAQEKGVVARGVVELSAAFLESLLELVDPDSGVATASIVLSHNNYKQKETQPSFKGFLALPDADRRQQKSKPAGGLGSRRAAPEESFDDEEEPAPRRRRASL